MRQYSARILLRAQEHHWNIAERNMVIPPEFIMIKNLVFLITTFENGKVGVEGVKEDQSRANLILFPRVQVGYCDKKGATFAIQKYIHGLKMNSFCKRHFTLDEVTKIEKKLQLFRKLWGFEVTHKYDPQNALRWEMFLESNC